MMAVRSKDLFRWLAKVGNANAAGEYYLPDIVMIAKDEGRAAGGDRGRAVRDGGRQQPRRARRIWSWTGRRRRREEALEQGATLIDPESVWFSADTELGRDCTIEPHVVFGPGVKIADGATIRAFSPHRGRDHLDRLRGRAVRAAAARRGARRRAPRSAISSR